MTPGREESRRVVVSVSSGTGSTTLTKIWSLARRIRVIPPSPSATYTILIKDAEGDPIYQRNSISGSYSESDFLSLGICDSITISNSTADGTFVIKLDMH